MKSKMQKFKTQKVTGPKEQQRFLRKIKKERQKSKKKVETDDAEIKSLSSALWPNFDEEKKEIPPSSITAFTDLPLSQKTLKGLTDAKFTKPTEIQRESLMFALQGRDILGAAKTGSGKTLAFLIPVLELLFRQRFTPGFGLAALIMSPTRELAYQSFDMLRKIGKNHDLSFGMVTGGMALKEEAAKLANTNVVICTPGRFLQHLEQTPNFSVDELKILVLDEADKILHLGFNETMNAVLAAIPRQRQTLLFSATQTKSVKDLARLSLKRPVYVSVHEKAQKATPSTLTQSYIICKTEEKVNMLWSFLSSHKRQKILAFMSCCKQVRYIYEVFKKMQKKILPGLAVLCLHGHMKQTRRMSVYESFTNKKHAILLATDVAARGLDFPSVNWVIQMDRPDTVDTYIHRVGRTARYDKSGQALLFLLSSEEKSLVEGLAKKKIPVNKLEVNEKQIFDITKKMSYLCAQDQDMKAFAQKAFLSVLKTLRVLDPVAYTSVDQEAFALSLGLVQVPRPLDGKKTSNKSVISAAGTDGRESEDDQSSSEDEASSSDADEGKSLSASSTKPTPFSVESEDDEETSELYDVLEDVAAPTEAEAEDSVAQFLAKEKEKERKKKKKQAAKEKLKQSKQTVLGEGQEDRDDDENSEDPDGVQGLNLENAINRMKEQDKIDRANERLRIKERHRERRLKAKEKRRQAMLERRGVYEEPEVRLGAASDEDNEDGDEDDDEDNGDDDDKIVENGGSEGEDDDMENVTSDEEDDEDDEEYGSTDTDDESGEEDGPTKKKARLEETDSDSSSSSLDGRRDKHPSQKLAKLTEEAALALLG